jgi:ubiquitin carboxyl-terminal hydrolase 34
MTRISKPPHVLIIHLQRIFFNYDTFINEKVTTKHEFPMELNIYNYTLDHFDK